MIISFIKMNCLGKSEDIIKNDRLEHLNDINTPFFLKKKIIEKEWGNEEIIVNSKDYCMKFLNFKKDKKFSMHFHAHKKETWYIDTGKFSLKYIDTKNASIHEHILEKNDIIHINILTIHQILCLEEGRIIEVSTEDNIDDNYRVFPGDNQNK
jgi:mannose-6-phosphate isomerase-like protein (cupin superfamily)